MRLSNSCTVLLGFLATSHGWILDDSCSEYSSMVIAGFQGGFDLAQAGADLFSKITPTGSGATWQAQKDLISYMFAEALNNGNIDTTNEKWETASKQFTSVLKYNNNNGQPENGPAAGYRSLNSDSLIVFCNYDRFKENQNCDGVTKKGITCDTTIGISWPMNNIYSDCKSTSPFSFSSIEAWTYEFASVNVNRASQIQLCPGFLKENQKGKVQGLKDQGKKSSLARGWKKFSGWMDDPRRTPMDVAYTFDATILHEMTHAVPNAATEDAGGKSDSYGWKNCNKMTNSGGTKNADSYSFFGLAARMISPTNGGAAQRPMSDGSIQVLTAAGPSKRDVHFVARAISNTAVIIDNTTVLLNASNTAGFVVAPPSTSPVTVSTGREYTIGTNVVSLGGSAVIIDHSTALLPVVSASVTSSTRKSGNSSSSITPITGVSTFSTLTRSQNSSSSIPSTSGISTSSSSSLTRGQNSSTSISSRSTSSLSSSGSSGGSSAGPSTGTKSSASDTGTSSSSSSSSSSLSSSKSPTSSSTLTSSQNSTSSASASSSGSKSGSSSSSSSSKPASNAASTSTSGSSSGSSSSSPSTSKSGSNATPTITSGSTSSSATAVTTITSGSSTSVVPITVINVSKSGTTSPVTYISTFTSSGDIKPTGAWMCTGPLCDSGGGCIIPLFCGSQGGSSGSWGLCCGWNPPSPPGGSGPPAGGPSPAPPPPPGNGNDPTGSGSDPTTTDTSTNSESKSSSSKSSSSSSSSSSCSTQTASACDTSLSVFTPAGSSTASTSTITLSCSSVTACSATATGSATTTTGGTEITATPIGDYFQAWDSAEPNWYEEQQSVLSEAMADDTEPYVTWSSDEVYVSYDPSSTSNSTTPASTSTSPSTSKSATPSGTISAPASSTAAPTSKSASPASSSSTSLKSSNTVKETSSLVSSSTVKSTSTASAQCKAASDCPACGLAGEVPRCLDTGTCTCYTTIT